MEHQVFNVYFYVKTNNFIISMKKPIINRDEHLLPRQNRNKNIDNQRKKRSKLCSKINV